APEVFTGALPRHLAFIAEQLLHCFKRHARLNLLEGLQGHMAIPWRLLCSTLGWIRLRSPGFRKEHPGAQCAKADGQEMREHEQPPDSRRQGSCEISPGTEPARRVDLRPRRRRCGGYTIFF